MYYSEEDFIQLSALQHFLFCPRQCALSYIEQVWSENLLTAEGRIMHDLAHEEAFGTRDGVRVERGMPLRSERLGLNGAVAPKYMFTIIKEPSFEIASPPSASRNDKMESVQLS